MMLSQLGPSVPFLLVVLLSGCDNKSTGADATEKSTDVAAKSVPADQHLSGEHSVKCGCQIEEVGHCGEYVEVEGQFVELELPASSDLGKMPFCGKDQLKATVEGELVSGKVVATSFELTGPDNAPSPN